MNTDLDLKEQIKYEQLLIVTKIKSKCTHDYTFGRLSDLEHLGKGDWCFVCKQFI